ncbi:GntP family permease [Brevibacterium album]|uniref:GntP family permease n=1 Tax=Brevibacterium album TaxID=417948 RepID=UPI000407C9AD|nr:gluconate:H+ symporter [Brevibacterium album]
MSEETTFLWELSTSSLLLLAAGAIALLLFLIMALRLHAFIALVVVSLLTSVASGIAPPDVVPTMLDGFGGTLASVALLVGLGAMLGRMLEASGGAERMTQKLLGVFGERRAPLAVSIASLLMGFPIFFDAGLVLMLPIIYAVARRLEMSFLAIAYPAAIAFSAMHAFVPPHPGPVTAVDLYGADQGLMVILGLLFVLPTWYLCGYLLGTPMARRFDLPVPEIFDSPQDEKTAARFRSEPSTWIVVLLLLLPLVLIGMNTVLSTLVTAGTVDEENGAVQVLSLIGETPVALLITVLLGFVVLGVARGKPGRLTEAIADSALGPVCSVILITGAGGMFGGVLRASGIGDAIADSMAGLGMPLIVAVFLVALLVRIAQGSATVALTTSAALMQPAVHAGGFNSVQLVALVGATAAGSIAASHVNDSGFWLVSRFFGMSTSQTLRTWTIGSTGVGLVGFVIALVMYAAASVG